MFTTNMFDNLEQALNTYKYYLDEDYMSKDECNKIDDMFTIKHTIRDIVNKLNENFMYFDLEDDNTCYGGTSFSGETIGDFINEFNSNNNLKIETLDELNMELVKCGIKPIRVVKDTISRFTYDDLPLLDKEIMSFLENTLVMSLSDYDKNNVDEFNKVIQIINDRNILLDITKNIINDLDFITQYHNNFFTYEEKYVKEQLDKMI